MDRTSTLTERYVGVAASAFIARQVSQSYTKAKSTSDPDFIAKCKSLGVDPDDVFDILEIDAERKRKEREHRLLKNKKKSVDIPSGLASQLNSIRYLPVIAQLELVRRFNENKFKIDAVSDFNEFIKPCNLQAYADIASPCDRNFDVDGDGDNPKPSGPGCLSYNPFKMDGMTKRHADSDQIGDPFLPARSFASQRRPMR